MAVTFETPPAVGHLIHWGGNRYRLEAVGSGTLYGRAYVKLTWRGLCKDCAGDFDQTSPLAVRRLATRCKACDPAGEKDAADRRAYMSARQGGRTAAAPVMKRFAIVPGTARLSASGQIVTAEIVEDDAGETYEATWKPGGRPGEHAELDALLASEHVRLTAEAML